MKNYKFLDYFPEHVYRYIDQTGAGRQPVSSLEIKSQLNKQGYESYFTVNGFKDSVDAKKENCTNINAFFIDIDGRKSEAELERIKGMLDPTFIVETKNGYHIYWVLDEPIYKDEVDNWDEIVTRWEKIEQSIVITLDADPVVKDITRIMRVPNTFYWKKSGEAYKKGTEGVFTIKGIYKQPAHTYSMDKVEAVFPIKEDPVLQAKVRQTKNYAEAEKNDFFTKVLQRYPMDQRESFKRIVSGKEGTLPPNVHSRNQALLVASTLMRQAGWDVDRATNHILKVGWHGIEKERGGMQEIVRTVESGYAGGYIYSPKTELIRFNTPAEEEIILSNIYIEVLKERKEKDKVRYSNYEHEIFTKYPHMKKNEAGFIFDYENGVYRLVNDQELSNRILEGFQEDLLWGYKTKKNVSDKIACLLAIVPDLKITTNQEEIINVKNGLLNIYTKELKPHTPEYVSLIQYPVDFDPSAVAETWISCVSSWMEGDEKEQKTKLLKQFSGYCLTSSVAYNKALFLVGDGGNGKSTYADTIAMVIGSNATSHVDLEELDGAFGMQGLIGKRLNIIEEVHGNYYQSNKIKKLISGEPVTINIKFKPHFHFTPEAKFIFAVNSMPRVDDNSNAMERRMCVIVFNNNFRDFPNTVLRSANGTLARELSGILNWMIEGAIDLKKDGRFVVTREQEKALKEYREDNSSVEGFIAECLRFVEGETTTSRDLYDEYKSFCQKDGRKFKSHIAFTKEMKAYGKRYGKFTYHDRSSGSDVACYEGVTVDTEWRNTVPASFRHF